MISRLIVSFVGVSVMGHGLMLSLSIAKWRDLLNGMVHANVGHKITLITLSKGYFCTNFYIQWSRDVTSPSTTTHTTNKHHHHGDGAARPSSGVDSMNPRRPSGGRPCACLFRGRRGRVLVESIN